MKPFFTLLSLFLLTACGERMIPLQGQYAETPYQFTASSAKQQTWSKLIDFFTTKGIAIKLLDENNGLMTTENTSFLNAYTWEKKGGSLTNPNAFVVCTRVRDVFTFAPSYNPESVTGQWVVRIKENDGKTIVNTRLTNATGKVVVPGSTSANNPVPASFNLMVKSTGVFEKAVAAALE